jgi:hypothetical protein
MARPTERTALNVLTRARLLELADAAGLKIPRNTAPILARESGLDRRYARGDGDTIRKLFQVLKKRRLLGPDSVIVWARDDDGDPERRTHATDARDALPSDPPILLAIASECGEAWVIAGWTAVLNDPGKLKNGDKHSAFTLMRNRIACPTRRTFPRARKRSSPISSAATSPWKPRR